MSQQQWKSTKRIIHAAQEVLAEENPMTVRQLFYRLVSRRIIENSLKDYRKISTVMTGAREAGEIPFEWIVDRSRPVYAASVHADPVKSIERFAKHCRVDPWEFQPSYVEVWTEKDAVIGSIEELTEELAVTVRACRGFASATWANGVAELFNSIAKPIYIFYLGDHDPSGRCIETELRERIKRYGGSGFKSQRLAIDADDIAAFNLPPLKIKSGDPRAVRFLGEHGYDCVELDALPPTELRRRLRSAIEGLIDWDAWNRVENAEKAQRESIQRYMRTWKGLTINSFMNAR